MHDTLITLQGNVGGDVTVRRAGDAQVASFRVACTPRRLDRASGAWSDGTTQWYTVNAWRSLGDHVSRSLRRGDPVFVQGRLRASTWTSSTGVEVTSYDVDATVVGHDLTRGTSTFSRDARPAEPAAPAAPAAPSAPGTEVAPVAA